MSDVRKLIYGTLVGFLLMLVVWFFFLYLIGCGGSISCERALPAPERTPIPTLIPATMPVPVEGDAQVSLDRCSIAAVTLIGAWVQAGFPEDESFDFTDANGTDCQGSFNSDVLPLFREANLWYPGSLPCASCHNADLAVSASKLDMTSYAGILAGSKRESPEAKGQDILGGGNWEQSILYDQLFVLRIMPIGRPADIPAEGPVVFFGSPKLAP